MMMNWASARSLSSTFRCCVLTRNRCQPKRRSAGQKAMRSLPGFAPRKALKRVGVFSLSQGVQFRSNLAKSSTSFAASTVDVAFQTRRCRIVRPNWACSFCGRSSAMLSRITFEASNPHASEVSRAKAVETYPSKLRLSRIRRRKVGKNSSIAPSC